jgi:hypothetical protein
MVAQEYVFSIVFENIFLAHSWISFLMMGLIATETSLRKINSVVSPLSSEC